MGSIGNRQMSASMEQGYIRFLGDYYEEYIVAADNMTTMPELRKLLQKAR